MVSVGASLYCSHHIFWKRAQNHNEEENVTLTIEGCSNKVRFGADYKGAKTYSTREHTISLTFDTPSFRALSIKSAKGKQLCRSTVHDLMESRAYSAKTCTSYLPHHLQHVPMLTVRGDPNERHTKIQSPRLPSLAAPYSERSTVTPSVHAAGSWPPHASARPCWHYPHGLIACHAQASPSYSGVNLTRVYSAAFDSTLVGEGATAFVQLPGRDCCR